jgi:hypothetical protein
VATLVDVVGVLGGFLGGVAAVYWRYEGRRLRSTSPSWPSQYEHEVVFSRLHERRVEVIADLYHKLVDAEVTFGSWLRPLAMNGKPTMT